MKLDTKKNDLLLILASIFVFIATSYNVWKAFDWGHDSWQVTEWLINYKGGFVRRGLPGELLYVLSEWTGVQANYLVICLSVLLYLIFIWIFLKKFNKTFPLVFLLSSVLIGGPAFGEFIIRKDIFLALIFLACVTLYDSEAEMYPRILILNFLSIIAILSHESFFFFGLPALILYDYERYRSTSSSFCTKYLFNRVVNFLPAIFIFGLVVKYKGNQNIAGAINDSWLGLWSLIEPSACCFDKPSAAIDGLQWTTAQGLELTYSLLKSFSMGIYVPLAWFITLMACFYLLIYFYQYSSDLKLRFAKILLFQFFATFPLFILGWDYGRWIFLWVASSLVLLESKFDFNFPFLIDEKLTKLLNSKIFRAKIDKKYLLFFGIPTCCWTVKGCIHASPLVYSISHLGWFLKKVF